MIGIIMEYLSAHREAVNHCIAGFSIKTADYTKLTPADLGVKGDESNHVYIKKNASLDSINFVFGSKTRDSAIFINDDVLCKNVKFVVKNQGNIIYIGAGSRLNNTSIATTGKQDFVMIGAGVSITSTTTISTGLSSGKMTNGVIIGDHCLLASEIVIRAADGHLILDQHTRKQINKSASPIIIEPYCWIGQRTAILKNVRVGACSIISFGAVVTKSSPRFSLLAGIPAQIKDISGKVWLRNNSQEAKDILSMYEKRFSLKDKSLSK